MRKDNVFVSIGEYQIDPMLAILAVLFIALIASFWYANKSLKVEFSALDLVMENGRVSKTALAFMLVLAVSTWIIIDMQIKGSLTEGFYTIWVTAWVLPLVARVVFGKVDMPTSTSITSMTSTTVTKDPAP